VADYTFSFDAQTTLLNGEKLEITFPADLNPPDGI
jgi:hypothetical protein